MDHRITTPTLGHPLPPLDDEQWLHRQAVLYANAYPDIFTFACRAARALLKKLTGLDMDPTQVYWHRFSGGANSSRSFSGWAHLGPPVESLTLVELLIRRFSVHDQDNTDALSVYQGFYTRAAGPGFFDEHDEIRLLPAQVLTEFWAMDFKGKYLAHVEAFWADHTETFQLLAKTHHLAEALRLRKTEGEPAYQARLKREAPDLATPLSIAQLKAAASSDPAIATQLAAAKASLSQDAETLITSNASLRKQLWRGYLGAFVRVFGPAAPLAWPAALAAVGASAARMGLDIDQAVNGQSAGLRKEGVVSAVLDGIFVLFNAPLLRTAGAELSEAELGAPGEGTVEAPEPAPTSPLNEGIQRSASGRPFITMDGVDYNVQYRTGLRQWVIVDNQRPPFSFFPKPVRFDTDTGHWRPGTVIGLRGGMPGVARDDFWDVYMRPSPREQLRLSRRAMERQRECLQHLMVAREGQIEFNGEFTDDLGLTHSVYQNADGEFRAPQIERYTEHPEDFNNVLRFQPPTDSYPASVRRIQTLADEVHLVGTNNAVDLFRGGNATRGTSGAFFRNGQINVGDILVNTDLTSFSENPYITPRFASTLDGAPVGEIFPMEFDDSSVVFVLRAGQYSGATPLAPFSEVGDEAESLMLPGHHFQIETLREVRGPGYRFLQIDLHEVRGRQPGQNLFELRTGLPYSAEAHTARMSPAIAALMEQFFPVAP